MSASRPKTPPAGPGIVLVLACLVGANPLGAQDGASAAEAADVLEVVDRVFEGMAERDPDLVESTFLPDAQLVAVRELEDGSVVTSLISSEAFAASVAASDVPLIERYWEPEVRIRGPLATVWTPYDLYRGEEFSHCGIDAITLVRTDDGWRISGIGYTTEPEGCPPSPLGPLGEGR